MAAKLVSDGILRGAGLMGKFMLATSIDLILRVVLAEVLSTTSLTTTGIWLSWPIGWSVVSIVSIAFCLSIKWDKKKENEVEKEKIQGDC